jgi:hypothetical protein
MISRQFVRWRDPDSNRGHHDFQGVAGQRFGPSKALQIADSEFGRSRRDAVGLGRFPARLGLRERLEVPIVCSDRRPAVLPSGANCEPKQFPR